jgi:hypothetical protein
LARPNLDGAGAEAADAPTAGPAKASTTPSTATRSALLTVARGYLLGFAYAGDTDRTTALNCAGSVTVRPCSSCWPVKVPSTAPVRTFVTL